MNHNDKSIIQKDFYRESGKWLSGFALLKKRFNPNLNYLYWFRRASAANSGTMKGKILRFILRRYQIKYGYQIYAGTKIGEGLYLGHWGTVIINPQVIIGKNCNIAAGVTIGQSNRGKTAGFPIVGDEVWIGTNAVIVGKITIGNNVLIAPNAYVTTDVPDNSVVVGNPAEIRRSENATDGYIHHKV